MKLITQKDIKLFKKTGEQMNVPNPLVVCRFFNPYGRGTWYATEYIETDGLFYGYVSLFNDYCDEWGYFSADELKQNHIERDMYFEPVDIKTACFNDGVTTI